LAMQGKISEHSTIMVAGEQVSVDLDGEAVILNLRAGVCYGLNAAGTRIWNLLKEPKTVNQIRDVILEEYEVEPERCESDLLALLQELVDKRLIEVKDETDTEISISPLDEGLMSYG
jgi:hypothetical protein